jgi:CBS domain-containing membrane protein
MPQFRIAGPPRHVMSPSKPSWVTHLLPATTSVNHVEKAALVCRRAARHLTGLLSALALGPTAAAAWLMAPMGASAVLLFAVPASPLAQPWPVLAGNLVAALVGVSCARFIESPVPAAAAAAIFIAIGAMSLLRCLHPPSGAVALMAVLGGPAVHAMGYGFVLAPVAVNSVLILVAALVYNNNVTGRRYPHSQQAEAPHPHCTRDSAPTARLGFKPEDLLAVLKENNQVMDISVDDLATLFRRTEMHAFRRRFGETRCGEIMSRDIVSVEFATELAEAWRLMHEHRVRALPVLDRARRVTAS